MSVIADLSELDNLARLLDEARETARRIPEVHLRTAARQVLVEAVANAQGMADTGELARSVRLSEHGVASAGQSAYVIGANVRQAAFLEYGSPNTGPPRPWLTAPAYKAMDSMAARVLKEASPW